jgi:hypothetical protein
MNAVQEAVVANYNGSWHPNAHGVSIYVPTRSVYSRVAASYIPLALSKATRWDDWLGVQPEPAQ